MTSEQKADKVYHGILESFEENRADELTKEKMAKAAHDYLKEASLVYPEVTVGNARAIPGGSVIDISLPVLVEYVRYDIDTKGWSNKMRKEFRREFHKLRNKSLREK